MTITYVVIAPRQASGIKRLSHDRSARCLYTVTGWGEWSSSEGLHSGLADPCLAQSATIQNNTHTSHTAPELAKQYKIYLIVKLFHITVFFYFIIISIRPHDQDIE